MKINIEDYLHKIDSFFNDKTQKDTYMTYVMVFAVIFAIAYLLFWDNSFNEFNKTRRAVKSLQSSINADDRYIRINPEGKIAKLDQDIDAINKKIIQMKDDNAYIKNKIENIASLIYDERTWGEYLHSISKYARNRNIKIMDLKNSYADNNSSFGHILDISIEALGSYKNTLNFINDLEQSELVVDIHGLAMKADKKIITDLNISVWGITY